MSKENLQDIGIGIVLAVAGYAMLVMLMLF